MTRSKMMSKFKDGLITKHQEPNNRRPSGRQQAQTNKLGGGQAPTASGYWVHKISAKGQWSYCEHDHAGYGELVCAIQGEFQHTINGKALIQRAGEIIFVREDDLHSLRGGQFAYVNVMFRQERLLSLEQYMESPGLAEKLIKAPVSPRALVPLREQAGMGQLLEQLLSHASSVQGRRYFAQFLLTIVTRYLAPLQEHHFSQEMPEWLRESLTWLNDQRPDYPALPELVKRSCRCHEHFSREFSRHMGVAPSRYLANLKIEHAAEMLLTTNHKLLEICRKSGFENESYFFRLFRECKGLTPREYRKAYGRRSIQR